MSAGCAALASGCKAAAAFEIGDDVGAVGLEDGFAVGEVGLAVGFAVRALGCAVGLSVGPDGRPDGRLNGWPAKIKGK